MIIRTLLLALLPFTLAATQRMPWFGEVMQFEWRTGTGFHGFTKIDSSSGELSLDCNRYFGHTSLAVAATDKWAGEVELGVAGGSLRGAGVEYFKMTGRYLWFDDLVGDPFSLTTGLTLSAAPNASVRDLSSFQAENFEMEAHVAIGKEQSTGYSWKWRVWSALGMGYAFSSDPWLTYDAAFAANINDEQEVTLFVRGLYGIGSDAISITPPFPGYASVDHHSAEIGIRVGHTFKEVGTLSVELARRVWQSNYPKQANTLLIEFLYPFGI